MTTKTDLIGLYVRIAAPPYAGVVGVVVAHNPPNSWLVDSGYDRIIVAETSLREAICPPGTIVRLAVNGREGVITAADRYEVSLPETLTSPQELLKLKVDKEVRVKKLPEPFYRGRRVLLTGTESFTARPGWVVDEPMGRMGPSVAYRTDSGNWLSGRFTSGVLPVTEPRSDPGTPYGTVLEVELDGSRLRALFVAEVAFNLYLVKMDKGGLVALKGNQFKILETPGKTPVASGEVPPGGASVAYCTTTRVVLRPGLAATSAGMAALTGMSSTTAGPELSKDFLESSATPTTPTLSSELKAAGAEAARRVGVRQVRRQFRRKVVAVLARQPHPMCVAAAALLETREGDALFSLVLAGLWPLLRPLIKNEAVRARGDTVARELLTQGLEGAEVIIEPALDALTELLLGEPGGEPPLPPPVPTLEAPEPARSLGRRRSTPVTFA